MLENLESNDNFTGLEIAIIGMNGRFPQSNDLRHFWNNLKNGLEAIAFFSDEELIAAGVSPDIAQNPHYVKAGGILDNVELFDASFFGFFPREAALMDPQHRIFLETAWAGLEHAGYTPANYPGLIGVYAGVSLNTYLLFHLYNNLNAIGSADIYPITIGNDKDFLPTRVSYKLDLRGPSVNVQSACSTSLVAVHMACRSLLDYQCDMALAGGVSIHLPQKRGYLYQEGGIASPDGHCRAFDAQAQGTVGGSGVGIVVLKRLADALEDGDTIHAVIKGSATNNDGALKVGFTAPGVEGQAEVIATAQALADVEPDSIQYIETHGTGTALGDPIEIAALTRVFREQTADTQFCAIGSVKPNIGHLDAAAGIAGLIKAVLALEHGQIPPSINFEQPNPRIDFANSPFYVNTKLRDWESNGRPRRAGVSSFGLGGTNAHVILEEAPPLPPASESRPWQLLLLSAKTETALDTAAWNLADYLMQNPDANLADVAFTYQVGRQRFNHRRMLLCQDAPDALNALGDPEQTRLVTAVQEADNRDVVFMFTGQGAQYVNMGRDLYETEPVFREQVDQCAALLQPHLGLDLRDKLYPPPEAEETAAAELRQTWLTQPALFTIEYALAQLWLAWGIQPQAMIGHSIGEYVAACLAGVFSLEDGLALVAARGQLMQELPGGAMLSVNLTEEAIRPYLQNPDLSLAVINAPNACVVAGPHAAIDQLTEQLDAAGISCRRLRTSHAFHSTMMETAVAPFAARAAQTAMRPPQIPFISNVTGRWITDEQATDPAYWASHLRHTVRFADGLGELLQDTDWALLEVGPGRTLTSLARQHPAYSRDKTALASLRHPRDQQSDVAFILNTLGQLWLAGAQIDWNGFYAAERRRRIPLPTYPFERQRYWIEMQSPAPAAPAQAGKNPDIDAWFYAPSWQRADLIEKPTLAETRRWLLFGDETGLGAQLADQLIRQKQTVITVTAGEAFARLDDHAYAVNPQQAGSYADLMAALAEADQLPDKIVHLWSVPTTAEFDTAQIRGFYSLLYLAQALQQQNVTRPLSLCVVTSGVQEVTGSETLQPEKATSLGPCLVIPQEYPHIACRSVDVEPAARRNGLPLKLLAELSAETGDTAVALRGRHRWVQTFTPLHPPEQPAPLRPDGVYLITGGLGRIGLTLAQYLAETVQARLILADRNTLPDRSEWPRWTETHPANDPTSRRIRQIETLEAAGAEVLLRQVNVADAAQMQALIEEIDNRFGALHGVIHAAGLIGVTTIQAIAETTPADCERQFQAKIQGTLVLQKVLDGRPLDFVLLQSSLAAVLGGPGFAAYAAANRFMDALALRQNQTGGAPWLTVNWDGWQFGNEPETAVTLAMTPEEGASAFRRALALAHLGQLVVSTGDLAPRLERWLAPTPPEENEGAAEEKKSDLYPRPALQTEFVLPRSELEEQIAAMWQTVLGLEKVGVLDDFFELGGHSLLATQLISRLRDIYKVDLPIQDLFEQPTVAGLAELITQAREGGRAETLPAITPAPRDGRIPLSSGQQRLWFLDQLDPGSPLYNNFAALRLSGEMDVSLLERCLNEIVARHESLRTTFADVDGQPVQIIAPELKLVLPLENLQNLEPAEQETKVRQIALQEATAPFNLAQGPLLRFKLLQLDAAEHVILIAMHHIISDGWSVGVFIRETAALYAAFAAGQPSPLPPLPIQYADYAQWQQNWLQGEALQAQLAYWQTQLADLPVLELPTDRPRPAVQTTRGASHWFHLSPELSDALTALSQQEGATLFMTLTAVLQILLYRYTGQEDICIGTPVANRNLSETEGLIGFLLNTLVLRGDLSGSPAFRDFLRQVRETALAAYAHQDVPFEMLVEALQPERDMSRSPLFQVMFDLQEAPLPQLNLPGLTVAPLPIDDGTAKFDLALSLEMGADGLGGYLNYNRDLFNPDTIERLITHFQTLLAAVAADPDQPIAQLPLLTEAEQDQLLQEFGQTAVTDAPCQNIIEQIETQTAQNPDAIALSLDGRTLTYAAINQQANQLARYLQAQGLQPQDIVLHFAKRSLEAIVGLLGILKAGGIYLPVEPTTPPERLAFMAEDAAAQWAVTHAHLAGALPSGVTAVRLDADWAAIERKNGENLDTAAASDDPAYVIYTSGSTGRPKGVLISHEALGRHSRTIQAHFGLTPEDRVLQFAAYSFDQSIEQILPTLAAGAALVLRGPEIWPPQDFSQVLADEQLTVVNLPPAYWRQWVDALTDTAPPPSPLRLVIIGGDVLPAETIRRWQQTPLASVRLLNAYGPTETTITALTFEIPPGWENGRTPIGRPLPNRFIAILDKTGQPAPTGVPGELHIGGEGVALGYLNRPDLTEERFARYSVSGNRLSVNGNQSPITDHRPPITVYRTGDLCRFLPNGCVEFLGRTDHQVKIRGFRIELGEIEAALAGHTAVREAVIVAREDEAGHKQLAAYFTAVTPEPPAAAELRAFLKDKLPDYMIPAWFTPLDSLPLTASGKINRRALPAPHLTRAASTAEYAPPRNEIEEELVEMWQALLGVEQIGIYDNFFDLGGHSLLATQLIARIRAAFQVDLPLRRLFTAPNIANLADLITEALIAAEDDAALAQLLAELEELPEDETQNLLDVIHDA
ncbi:MAG: amino acid adenylation domain-containing protein [Chloroflexi bacterium]|nr:amino acid adenylation domain-containing protein [Chloroflexota bacterium]